MPGMKRLYTSEVSPFCMPRVWDRVGGLTLCLVFLVGSYGSGLISAGAPLEFPPLCETARFLK